MVSSRIGLVVITLVMLLVSPLRLYCAESPAPSDKHNSEYEELQLFTDVLSIIQKSYVEPVDLHKLIQGGIKGMLETLDPHSSYMLPEDFREMKIDTRGEFGGLGIEITQRDGVLTIVAPIEDTPAYRAGLMAGDQILKIEDKSTKNLSVMDSVKLMRGPAGSPIHLTIFREGFEKPRQFTLMREIIKIKSVKSRMLDQHIGYVRLVQFQEATAEDLQKALVQLHAAAKGSLGGLVVDLRNNPGGLLDQAVQVADIFLPSGLIVYTEGREEGSKMSFSAHRQGTEPDYPMVVLIDGGSASASEIVAGALHDHHRALVLGTQSFGKGSVQTIIPMSDGSGLRLTTARYFTPNGTSIQATGITPDLVVPQLELVKKQEGQQLREANLAHHFSAETKQAAPPAGNTTSYLTAEDQADYQLLRAFDLLKGMLLFSSERAAGSE